MKDMKRIPLALLIAALFLGGLTGCYKQLELPAEDALDASKGLPPEQASLMVPGLYYTIMQPSDLPYFNAMAPDILAQDDYFPVKMIWFQVEHMYNHITKPNDILLTRFYFAYYTAVARANALINATKDPQLLAVARYTRAFTYYRMFQLFRRVPIVDEHNRLATPPPVATVEELSDFMVKDLEFCEANGPAFTASNAISRLSAAALLARLHRIRGDMAKAGEYAEKVIASGKFRLTDNPADLSPEYIFCLNGTKKDEDGSWGFILSESAKGWNCFAASQELFLLVKPGDKRSAFFTPAVTAELTYEDKTPLQFCSKYTIEDDADLIVSRLAEMYLISAEAGNAARLSELQAARGSSLSLQDERRLEMCFEFIRWDEKIIAGQTYRLPYPLKAVESNPNLSGVE